MNIEHKHDEEDFDLWLSYGMEQGYCGPPICPDHDGIPLSVIEEEIVEEHGEICVPVIRIYQDKPTAKAIAANHAPTVWRDARNHK